MYSLVCVCVFDGLPGMVLLVRIDKTRQLDSLASSPTPRTPQTLQSGMEPEPTATVLTVPR